MAKPKNSEIIVGLDIGTTKIACIAGEVTEDGVDIIGIGTAPSKGLRRGYVVSTRAEEDTGVLLVVDALADHGRSGGVDGDASSLDVSVRASV